MSDTPISSITIPAATTDELLHALSATVINQHGVITMLSGLVMQLYCTAHNMPTEEGVKLMDRLMAANSASANAGFIGSLQERREHLQQIMHQ